MSECQLRAWCAANIRVAIADPYLSQIRIAIGQVVYTLDSGSIPLEVRMKCEKPKDEPEMSK